MGVSETRSVLDLLPASGPSSAKRANSNGNQMMFGLALKNATAAAPDTSGKNVASKKDSASGTVQAKGNSVPQNGKEIPKEPSKSDVSDTRPAESERTSSDDGAVTAKEERPAERPDKNTAEDKPASGDRPDKAQASEDTDADKPVSDTSAAQNADADAEAADAALTAEAEAAAAEQLLSEEEAAKAFDAEIEALLADVEQGELSAEDFMARLEQLLEGQDLSLDDLKAYLADNGLMSEDDFERLAADPAAFLAQLQQWLQPEFGLAEKMGLSKERSDALAAVSSVVQQFNRQSEQDKGPARFADVLKAEGERARPDDLVAKLLKEQGAEKDAETFADKEKLFEQLLQRKVAENGTKTSGFAGVMLKEPASAGLSALVNSAGAQTLTGAEALQAASQRAAVAGQVQQSLPQLPVLRGLPGQPGATEALNERIMMMRAKGMQVAEIRLDPPDLGSLEIRVRMNGDATSIQFHSPNAGVREALEAQVNRLREMMEESGVNLAQVDVSDQSLNDNPDAEFAAAQQGGGSGSGADSDAEDGLADEAVVIQKAAPGVVDYFA